MQSGREDALEERYAIKFCFTLWKNTTGTYEMLQTAFGISCMNRASVFEWHKRSKEGREFDVNYSRGTEDTEDLREVCPKGAQRRSERKTLSWLQGDGRADQFRSRSSWCSGDLRWKLDLLLWSRDQETKFPVEACWLSQTQEGHTEQIHPQTFDDPFFDTTGMIYMHWVPTGQTVNKEYYVEVLRDFRKRFRWKRPAFFKSGPWHFQHDNAPVNNSILVTDYLTKMGIKTVPHPPYSPDLVLCDFWLFPKFRGCRYETIKEMKKAVTKVIDMLTQEDFHGTFETLLERHNKCIAAGGDYFKGDLSFMCVLSIKMPIRKKSGNLLCACICINRIGHLIANKDWHAIKYDRLNQI